MKPLTTIKLYSRDAMDPNTLTHIKTIGVEAIGELTIILSRDEMGVIRLDAEPELKPTGNFIDVVKEATQTLSELHSKLGETHIATNHALQDMFAIHKLLTG